MITTMRRIRIYGPRPLLGETTHLLQELGVVHIDRPEPQTRWGFRPFEGEDSHTRELVDLEALHERLKKILLLLPPPSGEGLPPDRGLQETGPRDPRFRDTVAELLTRAEKLHLRLKKIRGEGALLRKYEKVIGTLAPILEGISSSPSLEMVGITVDRTNGSDAIGLIEEALELLTAGDYQIFTADLDQDTVAAVLVFGRSCSRKVRELLLEKNLPEISLPGTMADLTLKDALRRIRLQLETLPDESRAATMALKDFSDHWYATLSRARDQALDEIQQGVMAQRFLSSRYSFLVSGWVPLRETDRLRRTFESTLQGRVVVEIDEGPGPSVTPVEIHNPALVRPFEVFTRLLPLPSYGSVDPAPFFAFFFPLFFGLILGDIGYGLVIMIIALTLRRKASPGTVWRSLAVVFFISSLYAIFFGVLFGEFFATLGEELGLLRIIGRPATDAAGAVTYHPLLYDRIEAMTALLGLAVAVGAAHVVLGILLGIVNALFTRRYRRLLIKSGLLLSLLCCSVLILSLFRDVPPLLLWAAAVIMAVSVVGTTFLEGFLAPVEVLSSLGNILSYARIMAIGLASVILGLVANRLGSLPDSLFAGVLIAMVLHAINIVFGLFSPTIHSMRLHFVEFFGKFYEPGGRPYQPFRKSKGA
jgi:V/A-type H+-transporting ATPase subunit I